MSRTLRKPPLRWKLTALLAVSLIAAGCGLSDDDADKAIAELHRLRAPIGGQGQIVGGIARACEQARVALVGGETAEHPGLLGPDDYDGVRAYARAKRAQVALNEQWANRHPDGPPPTFHAMHPGWADTPGVADSLPLFRRITGPFLRTPAEGADTVVWLAAADEPTTSGRFWLDRAERATVKLPWAGQDHVEAAELWEVVCRQTGRRP